jgi:hypothetical protein
MTKTRYLTAMTRISDHVMSESTPRTLGGVTSTSEPSERDSRKAYSGDVPMSP